MKAAGLILGGLLLFAGCVQPERLTRDCLAPDFDAQASPGDDLNALAQAQPEGAVIYLSAGEYQMQSVRPRRNQSFIGELHPNTCARLALLNGARRLTKFRQEGALYVAMDQRQQGQIHGHCQPHAPRCKYPEDFFIDDRPLLHVNTKKKVKPGAWFFDYDTGSIYFADDPNGRKIETSVSRVAFEPTADGVSIANLILEKYANPAQTGVIGGQKPRRMWIVENNEVRLNHGVGIRVNSKSRISANYIHNNRQLGVSATGVAVLVENNVIAHNGEGGYDCDWECGGGKFTNTSELFVIGNHVYRNFGPGLWTDIDNVNTFYKANNVEWNHRAGIKHEISYRAVIFNNVVRYNGLAKFVWGWGAQIEIQNSQDVEVSDNIITVSPAGGNAIAIIHQDRGKGKFGWWVAKNNWIRANKITHEGPIGKSGLFVDFIDPTRPEINAANNIFTGNLFSLPDGSRDYWWWIDRESPMNGGIGWELEFEMISRQQ